MSIVFNGTTAFIRNLIAAQGAYAEATQVIQEELSETEGLFVVHASTDPIFRFQHNQYPTDKAGRRNSYKIDALMKDLGFVKTTEKVGKDVYMMFVPDMKMIQDNALFTTLANQAPKVVKAAIEQIKMWEAQHEVVEVPPEAGAI